MSEMSLRSDPSLQRLINAGERRGLPTGHVDLTKPAKNTVKIHLKIKIYILIKVNEAYCYDH